MDHYGQFITDKLIYPHHFRLIDVDFLEIGMDLDPFQPHFLNAFDFTGDIPVVRMQGTECTEAGRMFLLLTVEEIIGGSDLFRLGGTGKDLGKRHPTIGNFVTVGAGAKVFGKFFREFPHCPVLKTLRFYCGGPGFSSWSGNRNLASHAMWPKKRKFFTSLLLALTFHSFIKKFCKVTGYHLIVCLIEF